MNADETETAARIWEPREEVVLMLAREREWAEAYAVDHPDCIMGRTYLEFLHQEIVKALGEV